MRGSKRIQKRKKDQLQERIALSFLPSFLPWLVCCTRVILVVQQHWDFAWNFGMLNLATWTTQKQQQQQLLLQICNYLQHKCRQACKYKIPFLSSSNSFCHTSHTSLTFWPNSHIKFFWGGGGRGRGDPWRKTRASSPSEGGSSEVRCQCCVSVSFQA